MDMTENDNLANWQSRLATLTQRLHKERLLLHKERLILGALDCETAALGTFLDEHLVTQFLPSKDDNESVPPRYSENS